MPRLPPILLCALAALTVAGTPFPATAQPAHHAPQAAPQEPGTAHTRATARRRLPNTVADVTLGIVAEGPDIPTVSRLLGERSQALLGYLRGAGAERLRTDAVVVTPRFRPPTQQPGEAERIIGYVGRLAVSFRVAPDRLPALLAGGLEHGANAVRAVELSPDEAAVEAARRELAAEATRKALAQAEAVAAAAGRQVAGVREIVVEPAELPPQPLAATAFARGPEAGAAALPPIATEAGEREIAVTVAVRVALNR